MENIALETLYDDCMTFQKYEDLCAADYLKRCFKKSASFN